MSLDLSLIWNEAWTESLNETLASTSVPEKDWRKGGRKTKDKPNGEDLAFWQEEGLRQVDEYRQWFERTGWRIATLGDSPAIEFEVRVEFGGVEVLGYADAMYETPDLLLVDYKTGSRTPRSWMQLCLYAQGIERQYGVRPTLGAYYMTRKGELSTPELLTRYDDTYFDKLFSRLNQLRSGDAFLPNLGDQCRTCDVSQACYANGGPQAHKYDPDHPEFGGHK